MPLTVVQTVAPSEEPVSVSEAKLHCRVDLSADDDIFTRLITAAREYAEKVTGKTFVTTTFRHSLDCFPGWEICLPRSPVQSITSVIYDATDGTATTLSASNYRLDGDSEPARLTPAYGLTWPTMRSQTNAVRILYVAGYGAAAAVPSRVKQAILMLVGHWYENRETVVSGMTPTEVPLAVNALLMSEWNGGYR